MPDEFNDEYGMSPSDEEMPAAPTGSSLSDLLEKIEAKFPDDEDVMAFSEAFDAEMGEDEDLDFEEGMDLEEEEMAPEESGSADFGDLFAEDTADLGDDEDEFEMPAKKPKKPKKL